MNIKSRGARGGLVLLGLSMSLFLAPLVAEEITTPDTLAWVNGEIVTSGDIDELLLTSHQSRDMATMRSADLPNFLKKAINDRLLVQDALAMGMDEETPVQMAADEFLEQEAIKAFVAQAFNPPSQADSLAVRAHFEKFYWKILLRQVSVRDRESAESLRTSVMAGADMDSLARTQSVDSHNLRGGLHSLKYWGDVENILRDAVVEVAVGDVSEVFPLRDAFAFIRVEDKNEVDDESFADKSAKIRAIVLGQERNAAFSSFLDSLETHTPILQDAGELDAIRNDAGIIFMGEFLREQSAPVLSIEGEPSITGTELRRSVSRTAMTDGTAPFDSILHDAMSYLRQNLLLRSHARENGYFEKEQLLKLRRTKLEQVLIEVYLQEMIVPQIVFSRAEFQEFYEENQDVFRGADEVRLEMVLIDDKAEADEMVARLGEGADFDFLRSQYLGESDSGNSSMRWTSSEVFAGGIQHELESMEQGETSAAIETRGSWMIFKLTGKRKGAVKPIAEVDMQIREVMFQLKFNELLDQHLGILRERSDIHMNQEAIEVYFGQGS